jgi:hypothetical protein
MMLVRGDSLWLTDADIDRIARRFLDSEYASAVYLDWPLDRRLEGFLRRGGLTNIADDGDGYNLLLDRVMSYVSVVSAATGPRRKRLDTEAR